jgi:conjugal transfer pilus assembly protein TraV
MIKRTILFLLLLFSLTACSAKTFNPYDDEFDCPAIDRGKCISVDDAYRESYAEHDFPQQEISPSPETAEPDNGQYDRAGEDGKDLARHRQTARYDYQETLYKELSGMLKEEETPLVIPPKTMRVLLLSYTSQSNELYGDRFIYFFATEATWSISTAKETGQ